MRRLIYLLCALLLVSGRQLAAQTYYTVDQIDKAKAEAHVRHLPIAWLSSPMVYLGANYANEPAGSPAELTALALRTLQGQAVIIFQDADNDLSRMPANMVDRIETKNEGDGLPNGWHYTAPKIIYVDPTLTTFLGCTLAPDVRKDREAAINLALLHIQNDPQAQALIKATPAPAPAATPPATAAAPAPAAVAATPSAIDPDYLIFGAVLIVVIGGYLVIRSRS